MPDPGPALELTAAVRNEDGAYWAEVRELPGCFASGESLDELLGALEEAVALYLADETGEPDSSRTVAGTPPGSISVRRPRLDELRLTLPA